MMDIELNGISRILVELNDGVATSFKAGKDTYVTATPTTDAITMQRGWMVSIHNLASAELFKQEPDVWQARAEAAERRVAELEARLAEQEWRPVTEDEPKPGEQVELLVRGYRDEFGTWWYPDGDSPINGWRPLPPPPQGENIDDL